MQDPPFSCPKVPFFNMIMRMASLGNLMWFTHITVTLPNTCHLSKYISLLSTTHSPDIGLPSQGAPKGNQKLIGLLVVCFFSFLHSLLCCLLQQTFPDALNEMNFILFLIVIYLYLPCPILLLAHSYSNH